MEDSCSRGILSSIENVDIERVRPKRPGDEDLSGYGWYKPQLALTERRQVTEQRRDQLLQTIYQEGMDTDEVESLVKEWIVLVMERDRLFRECLNQENIQGSGHVTDEDKSSYLRELRHLLRAHPHFAENSEELNIREALLSLETHVTNYCTRHNITSPGNCPPRSKETLTGSQTGRQECISDNDETPKPTQQVALDHQTGQSRISRSSQPPIQRSIEEPDCPAEPRPNTPQPPPELLPSAPHPSLEPRPTTPHPPLPAKPQNLRERLVKASPQRVSSNKSTHGDNRRDLQTGKRPTGVVLLEDHPLPAKSFITNVQSGVTFDPAQVPVKKGTADITFPDSQTTPPPHPTASQPTPPPPPPLPSHPAGTHHTAVGTVQFIRSQHHTPLAQANEGESLLNEPQDPSLEIPNSEERSLLMNEISSVGQTILRRTNRNRSPGGTPLKANKNRLTLTGNTDMLQRALISKFRSFHSTPIKKTGDKTDSMDVSNAWSDVNGSMMFEDPDITTTSSSLGGVSNDSSGLKQDPNLSTAV